ncbi:MAG: peptidase S10 [Burkholderiales bacterium]|nr:peptidase S10 [Burkholderiales bacterium]
MRPGRLRLCSLLLAALAAGCGGGGGEPFIGVDPPGDPVLHDRTPYSSAANASLPGAFEADVQTVHRITIGGTPVDYIADVGHLNALAPLSGTPQASMFYVAYSRAISFGMFRPLIFFYNGGPGSASVWLHLGSFGPRRIVTSAPATSVPQPFQLVDNAESLLDVADLVFVDAVGTGYSQAIAPFTNQSFWGVDADAAVMRDFIARYITLKGRTESPIFLFGESYGGPRTAVLAHLMLAAGMRLDGVVLQSPILDYNSNCSVFAPATVSCEGFLPSYGMTGAWFALTRPVPADADAYAGQLRDFAGSAYGPAATAWVQSRTPASATLLNQLVDLTGAPLDAWTGNVDLDPGTFRSRLVGGQLLGRYDARIAAPFGSVLASEGDPSSTVITAPFAAAARSLFVNELNYDATATYAMASNAINSWNFSHDGRPLPDTIPDLAAAMALHPALRTLSISGYHDLATPFRQTELDLARIAGPAGLSVRVYPGGHMTYLDDGSRVRLKADVAAWLTAPPMATAATVVSPPTRRTTQSAVVKAPVPPAPASARAPVTNEPVVDPTTLVQAGDPYLPPQLRVQPAEPSPTGPTLKALVERKLAERRANPYR